MDLRLSEVHSKSLPRQICIIVAVTYAISTGVGRRAERRRRRVIAQETGEGNVLTSPSTCNMR